jgi:hypothetical protein
LPCSLKPDHYSKFNDIRAKKVETAKDAEFGVSRGCFNKFNKRPDLYGIKMQGEVAAADNVDAEVFHVT